MSQFKRERSEPPVEDAPRARRLQLVHIRLRPALPFALGVTATLIAFLLVRALVPPAPRLTMRDVKASVAEALASATPPPAAAASVYQVIQPSLVLIQAQGVDEKGKETDRLGSGIVVNDKGDILTSRHVVADSTRIEVTFADGTTADAAIIAEQAENDIAVLHPTVSPAGIVPATLASARGMRVGDEAFAVGNPFGLYGSMSAGVISGFGRSFEPPDSGRRLEDLIQIDAAVNPGNSGGPLLNRYGQVVGIVVGIVNPTDQDVFIGIGFAVPIEVAGGAAGLPPY